MMPDRVWTSVLRLLLVVALMSSLTLSGVASTLGAETAAAQPEPMINIVVAVQDLNRGVRIPRDGVDVRPWPVSVVENMPSAILAPSPDQYLDIEQYNQAIDELLEEVIVGKLARTDILRFQPILTTMLAADREYLVRVSSDAPRLAVISAFTPELQLLLEQADIDTTYVIGGTTYNVGTLAGNDVVMFLSGVSMVNAAMKTQAAVDHFNLTGIVFSGIAGGVNPGLNIGDVTVPGQWAQYQEQFFVRETADGWAPPPWFTPEWANYGMMFPSAVSVVKVSGEPDAYEEMFWFPVDEAMLEVAAAVAVRVDLAQCTGENVCLEHDPKVKVGGSGVSGQTFVDNAEYRDYVWNTFGADALDMETAAVAHVAEQYDIPYIAFRSLSDLAGGGPGENQIQTFFQLAADNSATLVLAFLDAWAAR